LTFAIGRGDLVNGQTVGYHDEGTSLGHAECTSGSSLVPA